MDTRKKLEALRARTQANGCTAHEEEVAQARIAKLLAENLELAQPEPRSEFDAFEQMLREQRMRQSAKRAAYEEEVEAAVRRAAQRAAEEA